MSGTQDLGTAVPVARAAAHVGRAPQQSRSREKVARILATTARLLEERPFEEIGTKLIAAEAGVSVGILYRFFPDKEAIVASLVLDWMDQFVGIFDETAAGPPWPADPVELFRRLLGACADFFRRQPGFRQVWYGSRLMAISLGAESRENDQQLADRLRDVLTRGYGLPDTPETQRRTLIAVVIGDRMLDLAFRDDPQGDPEILAEAVRLMGRYLDVPPRPAGGPVPAGLPAQPGEHPQA